MKYTYEKNNLLWYTFFTLDKEGNNVIKWSKFTKLIKEKKKNDCMSTQVRSESVQSLLSLV